MINNSGINQTFVTQVAEGVLGIGVIDFFNNATAGSSITYINSGSSSGSTAGGTTEFFDSSTAGNATFINEGGSAFAAWGGRIYFFESASADAATIDNQGVEGLGTLGGFIAFNDNSTADQCTITNGSAADIFFFGGTAAQGTFINQGGDASHPSGGFIELAGLTRTDAGSGLFINHGGTASGAAGGLMIVVDSNAKTATLVANGGSGGGEGAQIQFNGFAEGAMARVQVFGNGNLDISGLNSQGTTIGTLEGDGLVFLGSRELSPGSNNLDSVFSGTIADGGFFGGTGGCLVKIGNGLLTLTGSNTYSGGTTMSAGGLVINNTTGSGTGTGAVQVNAGILAGNGTISGAVTVGTGSGTGAFLTPGMGASKATTLIIQSALTFKADATYTCRLNTKKTKADQLIANGVTIENGARFAFKVTGDEQLRTGKTATVISNTSATPISGTFANLPDASTFTVGPNTFQVSYEGGDGNDLTLMVVPQPSK
jgi:autotransporter-associated beta strand protein